MSTGNLRYRGRDPEKRREWGGGLDRPKMTTVTPQDPPLPKPEAKAEQARQRGSDDGMNQVLLLWYC